MATNPTGEVLGFRIKALALAAAGISLWKTSGEILGWEGANGGGIGSLPFGKLGVGRLEGGAEWALGPAEELLASNLGGGVLQRSSCLHLSFSWPNLSQTKPVLDMTGHL